MKLAIEIAQEYKAEPKNLWERFVAWVNGIDTTPSRALTFGERN